jgi:mannose-6-phosphate isomerase-like protein (cupin superfamily)
MTDTSDPGDYRPSPRPQFDGPALIRHADVTRHVWGDFESGEVFDWIYGSTDKIHTLVFGLAPGGAFRHSAEFRTVFGADEVLHVLSGEMVIANPETGEVLRVPAGESVFFGPNTWHHVFAHGTEPLRVLEFLAPPPSAGTTGAYARSRPLVSEIRYGDNRVLGSLAGTRPSAGTLVWIRAQDIVYRLAGEALLGLVASTEHLTVASLSLPVGAASTVHAHDGDEIVYVVSGTLCVRTFTGERTHVFELTARDAAFVPAGSRHEYRNFGAEPVEAMLGVAPRFLDEPVGRSG